VRLDVCRWGLGGIIRVYVNVLCYPSYTSNERSCACDSDLYTCCRYLCMDEADRMIDMGFEEDVRTIFSFFKVGISSVFNVLLKPNYPHSRPSYTRDSFWSPLYVINICQQVEFLKREPLYWCCSPWIYNSLPVFEIIIIEQHGQTGSLGTISGLRQPVTRTTKLFVNFGSYYKLIYFFYLKQSKKITILIVSVPLMLLTLKPYHKM